MDQDWQKMFMRQIQNLKNQYGEDDSYEEDRQVERMYYDQYIAEKDDDDNNNEEDENEQKNGEEQSQQTETKQNETNQDQNQNQQSEMCIICKTQKYKYTCPCCKKKTCGLLCLKQHKVQFDCDGVFRQEKQKFKKQDLTEKEMQKDFKFLERTIQDTETIFKKVNFVTKTPELLRFKLLKNQLFKKYHAQLQFAPAIIQRHRENMSFYYVKNKLIYINIEFIFIYRQQNGSVGQARYLMDPKSEGEFIKDILTEGDQLANNKMLTDFGIDLSQSGMKQLIENEKIKVYLQNLYKTNELRRKIAQNEMQGYEHWFDVNKIKDNDMIEISINKTIADIIQYLRIKEFPTFYLVHEQFNTFFQEKFCQNDAEEKGKLENESHSEQEEDGYIDEEEEQDNKEEEDINKKCPNEEEKNEEQEQFNSQSIQVELQEKQKAIEEEGELN